MELLIQPATTLFPAKYSFTTLKKTNHTSPFSPYSYKFPLHPPLLLNLPRSSSSRFRIYAHFGRPTNRQNYLRKKLTRHQQVRESLDLSKQQPSGYGNDFVSNTASSNSQSLKLDANSQIISVENSELLGESVNKNKSKSLNLDANSQLTRVENSELLGLNRSEIRESAKRAVSTRFRAPKTPVPLEFPGISMDSIGIISNGSYKSFRKVSRFGVGVVCAFFVLSAIVKVFTSNGNDKEKYTRLEKEMLERKIKARLEKEKNVTDDVEIVDDSEQHESVFIERPPLDKEELMEKIMKAKTLQSPAVLGSEDNVPVHFDDRIQEIRVMARHARELEKNQAITDVSDDEDNPILKNELEDSIQKLTHAFKTSNGSTGTTEDTSGFSIASSNDISTENNVTETVESIAGVHDDIETSGDSADKISHVGSSNDKISHVESFNAVDTSVKTKFRIIQSVKEAREYLAEKHDEVRNTVPLQELSGHSKQDVAPTVVETSQRLGKTVRVSEDDLSSSTKTFLNTNGKPEIVEKRGQQNVDYGTSRISEIDSSLLAFPEEKESEGEDVQGVNVSRKVFRDDSDACSSSTSTCDLEDHMQTTGSSSGKDSSNEVSDMAMSNGRKKWMEKNFHELGPVIEKIGFGFRDNYMVAKERTSQDTSSEIQMMQLLYDGNGNELEWMQDETLREIVFKVRDNELSGKDPFFSLAEEEKLAFIDGLEKKVELENEKLQPLHEWLHSNIENLDYGTDGISVYDPPEKVIPRWKGPPVEKIHEFLKGSGRQPEGPSDLVGQTAKDSLSLDQGNKGPLSSTIREKSLDLGSNPSQKRSRITIEGSDGSVRAGKKSGKEYWQHTKKWSRGFLESYNAENDPEIKSVMKDVGKDLDRWITDKEIKEAAELMDRLPEKGQKFIQKKLDKVKREMQLFGPQAVVEKYREYSDEKEKDYLWWLDLPFVLCIEMYTEKDGDKEVGFYSLEMAADLELDPKQYHVIAFEDVGDCKNMCYIIQAHLEMLGNGTAFVVAQRPKDAFREAKANGFSVTVLRKGELQLNVDQTLEEVDEMIAEIGSKMYQEKIMGERSLDISSMMKGVFGLKKPIRRKRWSKVNKPTAKSTSAE